MKCACACCSVCSDDGDFTFEAEGVHLEGASPYAVGRLQWSIQTLQALRESAPERPGNSHPRRYDPVARRGEHAMAKFYLLPPRPQLDDHLADLLEPLLPGLPIERPGDRLADRLLDAIPPVDGVYLVCRDELPLELSAEEALVGGYGAEPGDDVIEIWLSPRRGETRAQRWRVGEFRRMAQESNGL